MHVPAGAEMNVCVYGVSGCVGGNLGGGLPAHMRARVGL